MPCSDDRGPEDSAEYQKVYRLLCEACKIIELHNHVFDMSPELFQWQLQHKLDDARRNNYH